MMLHYRIICGDCYQITEPTAEVEQVVNDYLDVWHGDFSKLEVVAESVTVSDPAAPDGEIHGRDAFEAFVREVRTGFPDMTFSIDEQVASDGVLMYEWTGTGTHEGEFNDIPPTGQELELTGMSKTVIADGKVQEDRIYFNLQELFEQLGLTEE